MWGRIYHLLLLLHAYRPGSQSPKSRLADEVESLNSHMSSFAAFIGTTTLFAAFDPVTGPVLSQCKRRHRHQEFLDFLRHVDASVPKAFDVHLIIDNYATHQHTRVQRCWLAARPRYHVHFTPTYSSWLNQVEIWFNISTQKAIRRGTFGSVKELVAKIERFVYRYNADARPFS